MSLAKFNKGTKFTFNSEGLSYGKLSELGEGTELVIRGFFFTTSKKFNTVQPVLITDSALYSLPSYMEDQIREIIADDEAVASINAGNEICEVACYKSEKGNDSWKIIFK